MLATKEKINQGPSQLQEQVYFAIRTAGITPVYV
jgi:hypothetical protein